jgi:hypothetical protein
VGLLRASTHRTPTDTSGGHPTKPETNYHPKLSETPPQYTTSPPTDCTAPASSADSSTSTDTPPDQQRRFSSGTCWVPTSWGDTTNGAPVRQAPWNVGNNQQWRLNGVGNGRYQIINRGTNTALDGMGDPTTGATCAMWAPNSSPNNHWTITAV